MTTFKDGWREAEEEQAEARREHREALIRGYETVIRRYEKLGMRDRLDDARVVLQRLRTE